MSVNRVTGIGSESYITNDKPQRTYSVSAVVGGLRPTPPSTPKSRRRLSDDGNISRSSFRTLPKPSTHFSGKTIYNKYYEQNITDKSFREKISSLRLRSGSTNSSTPIKAIPISNHVEDNGTTTITRMTDKKCELLSSTSSNLNRRRSLSHADITNLTPALAGGSASVRYTSVESINNIDNPSSGDCTVLKEATNSVRLSTPVLVQANEKDDARSKKANNLPGIFTRRSAERNSFSLKERFFNRKMSASTGDIDKPVSLTKNIKSDKNISETFKENMAGCNAGVVGLKNLGNTCFMNSILQCLSNTKALTSFVLDNTYTRVISKKSSMHGKLMEAYASLMKSMWKSNSRETILSPATFKSQIQRFAPRFVGYNQQDAQEFLRFLLAGLHEDLLNAREKPKTFSSESYEELSDKLKAAYCWRFYKSTDDSKIADLFVGQLKSTLECTICKKQSVTFDIFWDLSLPIPKASDKCIDVKNTNITLLDCMNLFTREETLAGDNMPTCSKCNAKTVCTKKLSIERFPKILVIHFKRFYGFHYRAKLNALIDFPVDRLDLADYSSTISTSGKYNLYAVSNHSGSTCGGHYTAYCKNPHTQSWYIFNDTRAQPVSAHEVKSSQAYVLFYEHQLTQSLL